MAVRYKNESVVQDAMVVVAGWLSQKYGVKVVYHNGTAVDADIFKGIIRIPKMSCASGITKEALMLLRGRVYHEAGHIGETKLTKSEYPKKKGLFEILNALEDRRMERVIGEMYAGCKLVFRYNTKYYNKEIAKRVLDGKVKAPLWEALVAMSFMVEGHKPKWTPSDKAALYVEKAYSEFAKVFTCKNAKDCLKLAEKIYDLIKEASDEYNKENPPEEKPEPEKNKEKGEEQDSGEQGESQDGTMTGDIDDDEQEQDGKGGSSDESDESGESDENKSEDGDGSGSDESDEDGDKDGSGDSNDSDKDGDEDGSESGSKDGEDEDKGTDKGEGSEDSEGDSDESDKSSDDEPEGPNESEGNDGEYKPNDTGKDSPALTKGEGEEATEPDDEVDGITLAEVQNDELSEIFNAMDPQDTDYTALRDRDKHIVPDGGEHQRTYYHQLRGTMSAKVTAMTQALEQALRSMAKSRKNPYLRRGRIDQKRLVQIAKGLSKEVFYQTQNGEKLDVAVGIVIDESGSMCSHTQSGNSMVTETQLLAMAIGEALDRIGVPFEIIGTTTSGRGYNYNDPAVNVFTRYNPIEYRHYKQFEETWQKVYPRIVTTSARNNNIDGEAVEYLAYRLAQRKEGRKVIFSLSDGEPCGGQGNDGEMARNLMRVCERSREAGIEVYGFGIGTDDPETYYGKKFFIELDSTQNMGPTFVRKFTDIVTAGRVSL